MNIYEIFANRRSGHHLFLSWLVSNINGVEDTVTKDLKKISWLPNNSCHFNDPVYHSFFDKAQVDKDINEILDKKPNNFFINYEEGNINDVSIKNNNTVKIIFLRDFLNTFASKWKASSGNMGGVYFGFLEEKHILENIGYWKINARSYLSGDIARLKYEDLINNKKIREQFLNENFNKKEIFNPNMLNGTHSSFNTSNFNHRYKEVDFSEMFKNIVLEDKELNELISALGYNKIELILN